MSDELLINVTPSETRVALVENGLLQEVQIERHALRQLVGNIYLGKVARVLPGMQAAFVDIGLERAGFLHESDIPLLNEAGLEQREDNQGSIVSKVHDGKKLLVQVVKSPLGSKGARLSTHLSLSARNLVFMPQSTHLGVSQRIEDEVERERLRSLMTELVEDSGEPGGFIARTAAEGAERAELQGEMQFLRQRWQQVQQRAKEVRPGRLVYQDLPLELRVIRDISNPELERVRVDHPEVFRQVRDFCEIYCPEMTDKCVLYEGQRPLFDLYSVEDEISKALQPVVPLKSGGYLVIEQTEAMTTVDVNTGTFVGSRNLEETIFKTNLEAAGALARQLRVRNLGGIIIVDFIDMENPEHRRQVWRAFEKALERDRAKTVLSEVSAFGLLEMTRKRTRESLGQSLCEPCPECSGAGVVKSAETICFEIYREIMRESRQFECEKLLVLAAENVVERMLEAEADRVAELEDHIGHPIEFQAEDRYRQEHYDIIPV